MRNVICLIAGLLIATTSMSVAHAQITSNEEMVQAVDQWFNELTTLKADFSQIAHSGRQSQGELLIQRSDKLRLDYDRPSELLIIANEGRLVYYDPAVNQQSYLDTEDTPLGLLLAPSVSLYRDAHILDAGDDGQRYWLVLEHKSASLPGQLTLYFSKAPFQLSQWDVLDGHNKRTRVVLDNVQTGLAIDEDRFIFKNPSFYGLDAND